MLNEVNLVSILVLQCHAGTGVANTNLQRTVRYPTVPKDIIDGYCTQHYPCKATVLPMNWSSERCTTTLLLKHFRSKHLILIPYETKLLHPLYCTRTHVMHAQSLHHACQIRSETSTDDLHCKLNKTKFYVHCRHRAQRKTFRIVTPLRCPSDSNSLALSLAPLPSRGGGLQSRTDESAPSNWGRVQTFKFASDSTLRYGIVRVLSHARFRCP